VLEYLERILGSNLAEELPSHASAEGPAQLVGILLSNIIESGERPLLGELRPLYGQHFRVLRYLRTRLIHSLLADLPFSLIPAHMRRLRAQLDFGV